MGFFGNILASERSERAAANFLKMGFFGDILASERSERAGANFLKMGFLGFFRLNFYVCFCFVLFISEIV